MGKNKIFNILLLIISILDLISLVIFIVLYMSNYNFKSFMDKLNDRLREFGTFDDKYYNAFKSLFNEYYDSTGLTITILSLKTIAVILPIFFLLLAMLLFQNNKCLKQKEFLRFILSFIFLISCMGISIVFVLDSFNAKYKIELDEEKDNIYRFDNEFNKEIKDNLNYMYNRKIYMFVTIFFAQICIISLIILIITKYQKNKNKNIENGILENDIADAALKSN